MALRSGFAEMFVNTEMMNSSVPQNQSKNTTQQPNWILRAPNQQPLTDPKLRLFCIPHAGSGAYTYHSWIGRLPDGVEVSSIICILSSFCRTEHAPFVPMKHINNPLTKESLPSFYLTKTAASN